PGCRGGIAGDKAALDDQAALAGQATAGGGGVPDTVPPMTVAVACGALLSPPPNPEAELPDSTLFLMVSTPVSGGLGGSNGADLADHRVLRRGLDAARPVSASRVTDEQHPAMRHANPSDPLLRKWPQPAGLRPHRSGALPVAPG